MSSTLFPSPTIQSGPLRRSSRRKSHRFANQSFRRLAKRSSDVGLLFNDDHFRQSDRLISINSSTFFSNLKIAGKVLWKRPKQIFDDNGLTNSEPTLMPILLKNDPTNHQLFIGYSQSTPWLIAAALAVAQHRYLLEQLINIDEHNFSSNGIVKFTIWQMGVWHKVVVDDSLPTVDSDLLFTQPLWWSNCCWWIPLLEKAYAKLYGSYENMILSGSLNSALIDFSGGGIVETIDPTTYSPEDIWNLISKEFSSKSLLILKSKDFKGITNSFGLASNRYYLIRNIKKPMGTLKRMLSPNSSSAANENLPLLVTNTMADGIRNTKSKTNSTRKGLQEFWILSNNLVTLFDALTICRPYHYNKQQIHQLIAHKPANNSGLQFYFDVRSSSSSSPSKNEFDQPNTNPIDVCLNILQKNSNTNSTNYHPIGLRIYAIELNREFKVHNFSSLQLIHTIDPVQSRNLIATIRLPYSGRFLLKPICPPEIQTTLLISMYTSIGHIHNLRQLTMDMPKRQLFSFMSPVYPNAVTRITVLGAEGLEKQDRFGTANPYCIIRCGRKYIKSNVQHETRSPKWPNFSAIFYHHGEKFKPIFVEIWHRSLLVDYFIGTVRIKPKIISIINENDDYMTIPHYKLIQNDLKTKSKMKDAEIVDGVPVPIPVDPEEKDKPIDNDQSLSLETEKIESEIKNETEKEEKSAKNHSESIPNDIVDQDQIEILDHVENHTEITTEIDKKQNTDAAANIESIMIPINDSDNNHHNNCKLLSYPNNDDSSEDEDDYDKILRLPLTDKKNQQKRPGFILLRIKTVEDLKYF